MISKTGLTNHNLSFRMWPCDGQQEEISGGQIPLVPVPWLPGQTVQVPPQVLAEIARTSNGLCSEAGVQAPQMVMSEWKGMTVNREQAIQLNKDLSSLNKLGQLSKRLNTLEGEVNQAQGLE